MLKHAPGQGRNASVNLKKNKTLVLKVFLAICKIKHFELLL